MAKRLLLLLAGLALWDSFTRAQVMSIPSSGFANIGSHTAGTSGLSVGLGRLSSEQMTNNLYGMLTNMRNRDAGEKASSCVSPLDLKAPSKARREYEKGFQGLLRKNYQEAIDHLSKSLEIYSVFVAAHNALGSAYLSLGQSDMTRRARNLLRQWNSIIICRTHT